MTPEQEALARQYAADESVVSTDRALLRVVIKALDEREAQRAQAQHWLDEFQGLASEETLKAMLADGRAKKAEAALVALRMAVESLVAAEDDPDASPGRRSLRLIKPMAALRSALAATQG